MGRYGFRSGYVHSQNIQAAVATIEDTDTTATVSFADPLREGAEPSIVLTPHGDEDVWVQSYSETGFTAARAADSGALEFSWLVVDDEDN